MYYFIIAKAFDRELRY